MLSSEGYQERQWEAFPALRKALEDKQIPADYIGVTSVSDNLFRRLERLTRIMILVRENSGAVMEVAVVTGASEMQRDLDQLALALEDAARMFHEEVVRVRTIASQF